MHVVDSFADDDLSDPFEIRTVLLFFRGNTVRKDEGKVRAKLAKILAGYDDVHFERSSPTAETIKAATLPSCWRFDAIVSHGVPAIVSDQVELPYGDEIDYILFSVFFSVNEALQLKCMVNQLRQFPENKWIEMWTWLKKHLPSLRIPTPKKGDAVDMLCTQKPEIGNSRLVKAKVILPLCVPDNNVDKPFRGSDQRELATPSTSFGFIFSVTFTLQQ